MNEMVLNLNPSAQDMRKVMHPTVLLWDEKSGKLFDTEVYFEGSKMGREVEMAAIRRAYKDDSVTLHCFWIRLVSPKSLREEFPDALLAILRKRAGIV